MLTDGWGINYWGFGAFGSAWGTIAPPDTPAWAPATPPETQIWSTITPSTTPDWIEE